MKYRNSQQRERILALVRSTKSHPTAEWIYQQLKPLYNTLSMGTVYRNLNILEAQGVIQRISTENGVDRFEPDVHPHYHLICEKCGIVSDIEMPHNSELNIQAEQLSQYKIDRHRIDFFGLCPKCRDNL